MKLHYALLASTITLSAASFANSVEEYSGRITNIFVGKTETIKVGIVTSEEAPINCDIENHAEWPLYFESGQSYSDRWFDLLNTARLVQEPIRIGYTATSEGACPIEYLALIQGNGGDINAPSDGLSRLGKYGNIALNYTNGLTDASYDASDYYRSDVPQAAFDGYIYNEQIAEGLGSPVGRGFWLVKKNTTPNNDTQYWIEVSYDQPVTVTGFRVMLNKQSMDLGRGVRKVTVQMSDDGYDYYDIESYVFPRSQDQRAQLTEQQTLTHFRLLIESNYGDQYIEIDEIELYSDL